MQAGGGGLSPACIFSDIVWEGHSSTYSAGGAIAGNSFDIIP